MVVFWALEQFILGLNPLMQFILHIIQCEKSKEITKKGNGQVDFAAEGRQQKQRAS